MRPADISAGWSTGAPPAVQFSNQLFEDFKKLYELKPFINVEAIGSKYPAITEKPGTINPSTSLHDIKLKESEGKGKRKDKGEKVR